MSLGNPYVTGRPVGEGDPFAPRFKLLAAVTQGVRWKHRFVVVYGTPRIGKTTFLHQLQQELRGELPICPVEFIWPTGADAETAQCELTSRVSSAVADARARWAQEHAADPQPTEEERALVLLDGLHVCDLCRPDGAQFIAQWQAWLESVPGWQFVVTLSGQRDGAVLCNPVLAALPYEELENLTLSETEDLLSRPVKEQLTYSYAAMRRIWQLTTGHPYQVQLFGSALLNKRGAGRRVELHDVERVAPDVVAAVNPLLEALWQTCSSQEQLLLALSNELHGRHGMLTPRDLLDAAHRNGLELPEQVLQDGLSALLAKGLVRRLSVGSYALASEVLRLWLNRFHALGSTLYNLSSQKHPLAVRSTAPRPIRWGALLGSLAGLVLLLGVANLWRSRGVAQHLLVGGSPTSTPVEIATRNPLVIGQALGRIAYMAKDQPDATWDIWVMRGDGSDPQRLTDDPSDDILPTWSPDGKHIAFVSDRDGNKEIYFMQADGTQQINLTHSTADDSTPAWSPDGTRIAFSSYRDGNWEIYSMAADGTDPQRLTHNSVADMSPTWSPDGSKIAFSTNREGNWDIAVMTREGTALQVIVSDAATDAAPAWSPDGRYIAFETYRDGNMEIYLVAADGLAPENVSDDPYSDDHSPTWARDGTRLLFYGSRDGGWDIFAVRPDGSEKNNLTLSPALEQSPAWHE